MKISDVIKELFNTPDHWKDGYDWAKDIIDRSHCGHQDIGEWLEDCIKSGDNGPYEQGARAAWFDYHRESVWERKIAVVSTNPELMRTVGEHVICNEDDDLGFYDGPLANPWTDKE